MRSLPFACLLSLLLACGDGEPSSTSQVATSTGGSGGGASGAASGSGGAAAGSGGSPAAGQAGAGQGGAGLAGSGGAGQGGAGQAGAGLAGAGQGGAGQGGAGQGGAGQGGAGGSLQGGAGQAGSGQAGAGGSPDVLCDVLIETGAAVNIPLADGEGALNPALLDLGGGKVALAFGVVPFAVGVPPALPAPTLRVSSFDALGAWPPAGIAPLSTSWKGHGGSFALEEPPASASSFAVASTFSSVGGALAGPVELRSVGLPAGSLSDPQQLFATPSQALFFSRSGDASLVGVSSNGDNLGQLELSRSAPGKAPEPVLVGTGCATSPIVADAISDGKGGFLVATSSSRPPGTCFLDDGVNGPPTRLQIFVAPAQGEIKNGMDFEFEPKPLGFMRLLKRDLGAWLALGNEGDYGMKLRMIPVMPEGFLGAALVDLTEGSVAPFRHQVVSMSSERVGVVYAEEGGQVPHLMLRAVGTSGSATTEVYAAGFASATALASPAPGTLIVGWVDDGGSKSSLRVARYECKHAE